MGKHRMLTQAELKTLVHYDPSTGAFTRPNGCLMAVIESNFGVASGYVGGKARVLHNLAFLYMEGRQPSPSARPIKHINGDKMDLRFNNLVWKDGADKTLDHDMLMEMLKYDPTTGVFTWVKPMSARVRAGDVAGCVRNGYTQININGRRYQAHRLAWFYVHKTWPEHLIDHIDRDPGNNRISNLREATKSQNGQNSKDRGAKSGFRGVYQYAPNKWKTAVRIDGIRVHIGVFDSPEKASEAYLLARDDYYTHHRQGAPE